MEVSDWSQSGADVPEDPMAGFAAWYRAAAAAGAERPDAMTLATASADGVPSARIVALRRHDAKGFTFYTNFGSQKARELRATPRAALVFFWAEVGRQVRAVGPVIELSREDSERYFRTRPRGTQVGAWVSRQSEAIDSRDALEKQYAEVSERFRDKDVPLPPFWGGFRLEPVSVEFWERGKHRLHDRLRYYRSGESGWIVERLSP